MRRHLLGLALAIFAFAAGVLSEVAVRNFAVYVGEIVGGIYTDEEEALRPEMRGCALIIDEETDRMYCICD